MKFPGLLVIYLRLG